MILPTARLLTAVRLAGAALLLGFAGCTDGGNGGGASQLVVIRGSGQQAAVGTPVATPPAVRVQDGSGNPVAGVTVKFSINGGGGSVQGDSTITGADGIATAGQWVMGTVPGTNTLRAEIAATSVAVNITATAVAGSAVAIRLSGQQAFLALVGHSVAPAPAVLVVDTYGNPVPDVPVTFTVTSGGGAVSSAVITTNAQGIAQLGSWTLGASSGINTVRAQIPSGASITFTAQALTSAPVLTALSPTSQSGYLQFQVTAIPRVRVQDVLGTALAGVPVSFTITSGDGTVTGGSATTGPDGVASPTDWRIGLTSGTLAATTSLNTTPITFSASGTTAPFLIDLRFLTSINADQRDAFVTAARRWMAIIVGHLNTVPLNLPAGTCSTLQPAINETVRDVVIFAEVTPIDGPNNILGSASPCASRSTSGLTIVGTMQFDSADLQLLSQSNQLVGTITHEMAHVLGFGTAWSSRGLTTGIGTPDPRFIGAETVALWPVFASALGSSANTPPLENAGGSGTAGSHWRESLFGDELMTGYIAAAGVTMPLSRLTIASMKDLGYEVSYTSADLFVGHLVAPTGAPTAPAQLINERIGPAKWEVAPDGTMRRVQ